jgi:citrate synthase
MPVSDTDKTVFAKGLKGVVAAETSICDVDGDSGLLIYRGYNVDDLAASSTFEEVAYLLLYGDLPTPFQLDEFRTAIHRQMNLPEPVDEFLRRLPQDVSPMAALEAAVAFAGLYDTEGDGIPSAHHKAVRLIARLPTIIAAIGRLRQGEMPVPPNTALSLSANFLWMLTGRASTADEAQAMNLILILHAEHSLNASTFAARVIIATLTDVYSAVTGAIGALKGPLHGGANTAVLKTLEEIGSVERVASWVEAALARKEKFMGFGHAVYKTEDPRVKHLKEVSRRLGIERGDTRLFEISTELEHRVTPAIGKHCNVDFYSASVQDALGIDGDMFTCIFAASRIVGWCAHILEQLADNKIIRPSAEYVGAMDRRYVPIENR